MRVLSYLYCSSWHCSVRMTKPDSIDVNLALYPLSEISVLNLQYDVGADFYRKTVRSTRWSAIQVQFCGITELFLRI